MRSSTVKSFENTLHPMLQSRLLQPKKAYKDASSIEWQNASPSLIQQITNKSTM